MSDVRVLSASQTDTYRTCNLKWHYRYVEKIPEEQRGSALVVGIVVDVAIKRALNALRDGEVCLEELSPDRYFEEAWAAELESTTVSVAWGTKGEKAVKATAQGLVRTFLSREDLAEYAKRVEALDVAFELPVLDPTTGHPTGVALRGFMDLVVRDDQGRIQVLDLKTSASRAGWSEKSLRFHLQGSIYAWALPQMYPRDDITDQVVFDVGIKLKEPVWERHSVVLGEDAQRRALLTVMAAHRGMDLGVAFPTPGWSCPTCAYANRCSRWQDSQTGTPAVDIFSASI